MDRIGVGFRGGMSVNYTGQIFQITDYEPWLHPYRDSIPFTLARYPKKPSRS